MILASKMMLEWLSEKHNDSVCMRAANAVEEGMVRALSKGLTVPDFGGELTTVQMGEAIASEITKLKL